MAGSALYRLSTRLAAKVTCPVARTKCLNCRFVTGVRSIQKPSTATARVLASSDGGQVSVRVTDEAAGIRVRPALMLDASAGSLRKAPGLSSYPPPRDKPGAGPLVRAGLFTGAPSAIESWATPGRRPRSQPRAPLKRSISAWRGGEQ